MNLLLIYMHNNYSRELYTSYNSHRKKHKLVSNQTIILEHEPCKIKTEDNKNEDIEELQI